MVGNIAQTSLIKSAETYSDMSPAHKEEMKLSTKQNFFSAQLLTSNIEDWQIKVVTYGALEEIQSSIGIDLTLATDGKHYKELEHPELIDVNLQGEFVEYTYQFTRKNQWLWQFYQQQLFDLEKPEFNFLLQPRAC